MSRQLSDRDLRCRLSLTEVRSPTLPVPPTPLPRRLERHDVLRETPLSLCFQLQHEPDPESGTGGRIGHILADAGRPLWPVDDTG